ncbi:F-box domain cyclin-like protein [Lasiodiplodia theobromae]|uniref:F-box domain-containing protein n=1 Tax=Lasiodiplodia theobromae TaxID=45133 RepID=A0A5N5DJ28_9PEZI|nr:F-box domain cyclin-containing protein [Lasiodiplodia theobromae]KAB2577883.1 hypothetical protein DBV05_g3641 [Lasiodiplodia theobromae]KAF4538400.1 F-box domain cyclin-containing protein [Lasiodiplodia theobromae]KAF9633502.1 F-box domain cyclin-like protein [Lasiodiplodia theobromae]
MASPSLPALPTELIQEIARYLDSPGQLSLRLACRQLHAKTHHTFLDAHFSRRRHLFTEHSLKGLVALAQHADLGPAVRRLDLSLLPFEQQRDRNAMHNPTSPFHVPCPFRRAALTVFLNAQARCRRQNLDVELLTEALLRLPNLRALRVRNEPRGCWGFQRLGRELGWPAYIACGSRGQQHGAPLLPGTYAFETALVAIAAAGAGAAAIDEIEVEGGLPPSALVLSDLSMAEQLRAPLANLRVLTLFVNLPLRTVVIGDQEAGGGAGGGDAVATDALQSNPHFLSLLPNLEVLRLGAARGRTSNLDCFLAEVFLDVAPRKLKGLHLLHLDCRRDVLVPILRRCETLEYLVLEDGAVRDSCWRTAMRYAAEARHPSLAGVLCKRFEVLPDDEEDEDVAEGMSLDGARDGDGDDGERSPFLEYGDTPGPARHLVVDREDKWPGQQLPWRLFMTLEFWEKDRVLFQIQ